MGADARLRHAEIRVPRPRTLGGALAVGGRPRALGRLVHGRAGRDVRRRRAERLRQVHPPEARRGPLQADGRNARRDGQGLGAHRARGRLPPGDLGARERRDQRRHARPHAAGDREEAARDRRVLGARGVHRRARQDVLLGDVRAARVRGGRPRRPRRPRRGRGARRGRRGLRAPLPRHDRGVLPPRQDDLLRVARARARRGALRPRPLPRSRKDEGARRPARDAREVPHGRRRRGGRAPRARPGRKPCGASRREERRQGRREDFLRR